jgi:glycerophosphoryl diester phosphodiesterase
VVTVLGHRGAAGYLPDHTLEGYRLAIAQGADYIEPDVVATRDHALVARHENELSLTTDVAERFPDRRTTKEVDGRRVDGWFVEDLTLAELRTLRARQPLPFRDHAHDGRFVVPTLAEVVALAREAGVGVIPETKHPSYFRSIGLPLEDELVRILGDHGFRTAADPVWIQSFEGGNLAALGSPIRKLRLVEAAPTEAELDEIAGYAHGIGVPKAAVIGADGVETGLVGRAHARGLEVHVWTFRSEPQFLPAWAAADPVVELRRFYAAHVDAVFADFPDVAARARSSG